jgi:glutaredoxin
VSSSPSVEKKLLAFKHKVREQDFEAMNKPEITAFLKTYCGWSNGVRAVLKKYDLPYTEKDIIQNPAFRWEMEQKSGQPLSPCIEINGQMLADVSGEEVEEFLISNNLVLSSSAPTDVPTNAPCPPEQHEAANVVFRR